MKCLGKKKKLAIKQQHGLNKEVQVSGGTKASFAFADLIFLSSLDFKKVKQTQGEDEKMQLQT